MTINGETIIQTAANQTLRELSHRITARATPLELIPDHDDESAILAVLCNIYLAGYQCGVLDESRRRKD